MSTHLRCLLTTACVIAFSFFSSFAFGQATVSTDQSDYPPGSTVIISGSGFQPGELVTLQVTHVGGGDDLTSPAHQPWTVTADSSGNISSTWLVPADEDELNATLLLTAVGQSSGLQATETFTDAARCLQSVTITGNQTQCQNTTPTTLTSTLTSGGSGGPVTPTYQWYSNTVNNTTSGTPIGGATSSTYIPPTTSVGVVFYYVIVTNTNGSGICSGGSGTSNTVSVTVTALPGVFSVTGGGAFCSGGAGVAIGLSGSESGVSYQLKNGATNVGNPVTGTGFPISFGNQTNAGTYTVVATNAATCTSNMTGSATVSVNPLPNNVTNGLSGNTICNGDVGQLTFDAVDASFVAPYTIQYSDGTTTWSQTIGAASATTFNVAVNPTATTTYTLVSITNGNNCTTTTGFGDASATITVRPTPMATIGGGTTVCQNGTSPNITFTNPQNLPITVTYNINGGGSNTVNVAANATTNVAASTGSAGTFTYNLVSVNYQTAPNCSNSISGAATVIVRPTPTATISGTTAVCQNGTSPNVTFNNPQSLDERITYNINGGTNTTIDVPATSSSTVSAPTNTAGTFNYNLVSVVYLDGTPGCSNNISGTATITVRATPTATITINGANPICSGSTTTIKFNGPTMGVVTYDINGDVGNPITANLNNGGNFILTTAALTSNTTYNLISVAYGDNPGCSATATGSVTVTVNQPPVITQPSDIPVNTDPDLCSAVVTYTITATGTAPITYTYSFTGATTGSGSGTGSGSTFNKGVTTVSITASNSCTPSDTKSFSVTVTDGQKPTITTGTIASCFKTVADAQAAAIAATSATDNCPGTITYSASTSGTCNAVITVTATDVSNNSNTTTYNTKILTTAPVVPTDGNSSVECLSAATTPTPPAVTDACGTAITPSLTSTDDSPDPLTCEGTRTYTYTYTDCAGNSSVWKYVYTIHHVTNPSESGGPVSNSSTVACASAATAPSTLPVIKDVCGNILSPTGSPTTGGTYAGCEGTITYTYHYTDCSNLGFDWTYTYTIKRNDFTIPTTTSSSQVACALSATSDAVTLPVVKSDCGETLSPSLPVTNKAGTDTYAGCEGTISYTWTYTDCAGHSHDFTYTYTVKRNDFSIPTTTNSSQVACASSTTSDAVTLPVVKSDCGETLSPSLPVTNKAGTDTYAGCEGTISYTWTYTDCAGHSHDFTYTYTVKRNDFTIPTTTNSSQVACASSATSVAVTLPVVKSDCGETLSPSLPVTNKAGTDTYAGCEGTISYTWTYTDCAGHSHDFTYTYTIKRNDFSIPTIAISSTVACAASATSDKVTLPTVQSDCGETLTPTGPVTNKAGTDTYAGCEGTISYTWTYTDCAGHAHDWTYTYTVKRNDFVITPASGGSSVQCLSDATSPTPPTVKSDCGETLTPSTPVIVDVFNGCSGTRTYTWTYQDCAGHSHNWVYTYTIADNIKPTISNVKGDSTRVFELNQTYYLVKGAEFNETANDNCSLASMIYSLSGATTGGGTSTSTSLAGVHLNGGVTTVTWTATDACGNQKICSFKVTVNQRITTIVYSGVAGAQYSDPASLSATLTDKLTGTLLSGKTVTFTIGTQTTPGTATNASGVASTTLVLTQDPSLTYNVATNFAGDATYLASSDLDGFDITQENACASYTGDVFVNSNSASGGTGTVNLRLTLTDTADGYRGDISHATVSFTVLDNGTPVYSGLAAPMVTGSLSSDKTVASFAPTSPITLNIGTNLSKTFDISWAVGGYYQSSASDCSDIASQVTVSAPTSDFVTGGGYIILDGNASGKYKGDPGTKNNFGFNAKWNKSLSNIQSGGINIIIRQGNTEYQVKGTKVTALGVTPAVGSTPATATITVNAVVNTIVNNVVVASDGNSTALIEVTDVCEPGSGQQASADLIAITVRDKNGILTYSNHWNGKTTDKVPLNGGNIQVHGDNGTGAPKCGTATSARLDVVARQPEPGVMKQFDVKAFPNPSQTEFTLKIESNNTKDQISMRVVDMLGRTVQEFTNLTAGQTLQIGGNYKIGIYFVDVMQGDTHKQLKLIKQ